FAALPAMAQVATSTAGDVGSASLRGAYPGAGGAVALPFVLSPTAVTLGAAVPNTGAVSATAPFGATGGTSIAGGSDGGGGSRSGNTSRSGTTSATARSSGRQGGGNNWVLCPPGGATGPSPLFTGTDLSCALD
ncbi:MAG TPA: hypothetical protein VJR70_09195, partial [Stellaceae bacterium]|nr:hypothetical protein [Stellaceae bacterium]